MATYGGQNTKSVDELIDSALSRMEREPDPVAAAANLMVRWSEGDSEVRALLPDVMRDYIEKRVRARAAAELVLNSSTTIKTKSKRSA